MTEQTTAQADPALNGKAQAVPPDPGGQPEQVTGADRALGVLIIGIGLVFLFMGIDRVTGGVLTASLTAAFGGGDDGQEARHA